METGGDIAFFLGPIDGLEGSPGKSEFVVDANFNRLLIFDGYINIHESNSNLGTILGQGNIGSNSDAEVVESDLTPVDNPKTKEYMLEANQNGGLLPDGVDTVTTFEELTSSKTLVKLDLVEGTTGTPLSHPAHIHFNNVVEGGDIAFFLGPVDGLDGSTGTSYAIVDESVDFLDSFDGYINIHESNSNLGAIVSQGNIGANADLTTLRKASFDLGAVSNGGLVPSGVNGTATFWELNDEETVVTLNLEESTGAPVVHPSHIHLNSVAVGGGIEFYLTPIDGSDPGASSARIIKESFDTLIEFDGYINIHESVENLGIILSQGNIGSNANVEIELGLDTVADPQSITYDLNAAANEGTFFPNGVAASATFGEITEDLTIVTFDLETEGATGTAKSHPAHIHENSVDEGGDIAWYLGAIDATDPDCRSSMLIAESFGTLSDFDGYINVHERLANLSAILSQVNIGSNVGSGGNGNGNINGNGGGY